MILLKSVSLFCLFCFSFTANVSAKETPHLSTDQRDWKIILNNVNPEKKAILQHYAPDGQTTDNWKELLTVQFYPGMQKNMDLDNFLKTIQSRLLTACPNLKWYVHSFSGQSASYEWSVDSCKGQPDQTEVARLYLGKEGLHIWHYSNKDAHLPEAKKQEWLDRLNRITVTQS